MVQAKEAIELKVNKEGAKDLVPDIMVALMVAKEYQQFRLRTVSVGFVKANMAMLENYDGTYKGNTPLIDRNLKTDDLVKEIMVHSLDRLNQDEVYQKLEAMFKRTKKIRKVLEAFVVLGEKI